MLCFFKADHNKPRQLKIASITLQTSRRLDDIAGTRRQAAAWIRKPRSIDRRQVALQSFASFQAQIDWTSDPNRALLGHARRGCSQARFSTLPASRHGGVVLVTADAVAGTGEDDAKGSEAH